MATIIPMLGDPNELLVPVRSDMTDMTLSPHRTAVSYTHLTLPTILRV